MSPGDKMAEYLASARTPDDRKVTERIEAESADQVVQILRDRGYADIVLHTDDVSALYSRQSEVDKHISPREYVQSVKIVATLAVPYFSFANFTSHIGLFTF
jgi:type II secretory pathway component PulF